MRLDLFHTPGIRRALKALAATRRENKSRVAAGKDAIIAGKHVKPSTYKAKYGVPKKDGKSHSVEKK